MSTCSELRAAQRQVHRAIKNMGEGTTALVEALTLLSLSVDAAIEQLTKQIEAKGATSL